VKRRSIASTGIHEDQGNIPVVSVIWTYSGISPQEMADVVTVRCERSFTTNVNDIEHIESQSLPGSTRSPPA
jgi:multidrug efflux pump subunit AcrB